MYLDKKKHLNAIKTKELISFEKLFEAYVSNNFSKLISSFVFFLLKKILYYDTFFILTYNIHKNVPN